jgi:hypothetical protein
MRCHTNTCFTIYPAPSPRNLGLSGPSGATADVPLGRGSQSLLILVHSIRHSFVIRDEEAMERRGWRGGQD